jgi:hypothetical protein
MAETATAAAGYLRTITDQEISSKPHHAVNMETIRSMQCDATHASHQKALYLSRKAVQ